MKSNYPQRGFTLILCLFAVVLATLVVITLLEITTLASRRTKLRTHTVQAHLISKGAISHAKSLLGTLIKTYPDSITAWQSIPTADIPIEATVLHFRSRDIRNQLDIDALPEAALPSDSTSTHSNLTAYGWPLISGAIGVPANQISKAFPKDLSETHSVDLNQNNRIGNLPNMPPKSLYAQWIEILRFPDQPRQVDPTHPNYNPPIGRYAFWIEDASFRINLNTSTHQTRNQDPGKSPEEISLQAILSQVSHPSDTLAEDLIRFRNRFKGSFPSLGSLAFISTPPQPTLPKDLQWITTLYSSTYDVMRSGARRVNINHVFTSKDTPRKQLDRFIETIIHPSAAPDFGQRFYRDVDWVRDIAILNHRTMVDPWHAKIYLQKIAANVKDYIDSDSQPTIIDNALGFPVRLAKRNDQAIRLLNGEKVGENPIAAIGKENIPRLQEYAIQVRLLKMNPPGWSLLRGSAMFEFTLDHYFEFWNMGTRDIVLAKGKHVDALGNDAVLTISNQPSLGSSNGRGSIFPPIAEGRSFSVPLKNAKHKTGKSFRIPAGQCVVLTTDPSPNTTLLTPGADVFILPVPDATRRFKGTTTDYSDDKTQGYTSNFNHTYRVVLDARSNQDNDYETCVVISNSKGWIESFCALPIVRGSGYALSIHARSPNSIRNDTFFVRGGNLRGNSAISQNGLPVSTSGDPRSLNEQLEWSLYEPDNISDSTRFYWNGLDDGMVPARSSMGQVDSPFLRSKLWPDTSPIPAGADDAPSWINNNDLELIGELGHVYDPARVKGSAHKIEQSRGGGRTLKIGQPEEWDTKHHPSGLWDGQQHSASRTWTAWRLADLFTISKAFRIPGQLNLNGILRDGGLAFTSLLEGLQFLSAPEGGRGIAEKSLSKVQIHTFVQTIINRVRGQNLQSPNDDCFFWERGEISELPYLSDNAFKDVAASGDRGREEINRRIMDMITTRGSVFMIHVAGQAISLRADGSTQVLSSKNMTEIVEFEPLYAEESTDNFDPNSTQEIEARFASPTNYRIHLRARYE